MHVAAGGDVGGVGVGMGIEPQHPQRAARCAAVPGHGADGSDGQAVVTTQQHGQLLVRQGGFDRVVNGLVPGHHFGQVAITRVGWLPGVGRAGQVALVSHLQAAQLQGFRQSCHTQGIGPQAGAAHAGANIGGGAYQADGGHGAVRSWF